MAAAVRSVVAPREREKRETLHWGKGRLCGKRGRKQLSQGRSHFSFLPVYPRVNGWAGDYPLAWLPPRHAPQPLIPGRRGSGKARGTDSFSKTPLTSLSPQHVLPCHCLGGKQMCNNVQILLQELCKPCGRERGNSGHSMISHSNLTTSSPVPSCVKHPSALQISSTFSAEKQDSNPCFLKSIPAPGKAMLSLFALLH